ncbi:hypothetical protein, partial [Klebsiella pneumoniae]|uniref:hypothetical protein n=1 Tax=Klebsiella pneumoniae TaxID=573 RepID=UPI003EFE6572
RGRLVFSLAQADLGIQLQLNRYAPNLHEAFSLPRILTLFDALHQELKAILAAIWVLFFQPSEPKILLSSTLPSL